MTGLDLTFLAAGGGLAFGAVTIGFAALGFCAGSWATRRKRLRYTKARRGGLRKPLLHGHVCGDEEDRLLEYGYEGMPLPPREHVPRPGSTPALNGSAPGIQPLSPPASYDHGRAEALVKLAQMAYKRPTDGEGYRTRNIRGLPAVTFFDKDLLTKVFSGVLHVHVHGANNLRRADLDGLATPYVEVFVASSSFRTKTSGKTLDPLWKEDHWLYIKDPDYDALCVRVVDEDRWGAGDDMGVAVLGLVGLVENPGKEFKFRLPLRGFAGENSTVTLACCYHPFTGSEGPDSIPDLVKHQDGDAIPSAEPITLADLEKELAPHAWGFKPVAYVDCGLTETQAWVFTDPEKRQLAIAFRGTEQTQIKDIITDARLMPCAFKTILEVEKHEINVHRGFMRAYKSVRRLLSGLLHAITVPTRTAAAGPETAATAATAAAPGAVGAARLAGSGSGSGSDHADAAHMDIACWEVLFTGHSLGGALATLGAYECALYKSYAGCIKSVSLYTYGSPRVGNVAFARDFDRLVPDTWRFTNHRDLVTSVPLARFLFRYCHVGHPVRLRDGGELLRGANNLEAEAAVKTLRELRKDVQADVFWLRALLSLRGFKEHNGALYESRLAEARKRQESVACGE